VGEESGGSCKKTETTIPIDLFVKTNQTQNMKNKTIRPRALLPAQAARFLAGIVTARLTSFVGTVANLGDRCPLVTFESEIISKGNKCHSLATVTITDVLPAVLDSDLLIVGQVRMAPDSPEALVIANACGFSSFGSLAESFTGRLPFIGHVIHWAPYHAATAADNTGGDAQTARLTVKGRVGQGEGSITA
jgi:hypothetical protein